MMEVELTEQAKWSTRDGGRRWEEHEDVGEYARSSTTSEMRF